MVIVVQPQKKETPLAAGWGCYCCRHSTGAKPPGQDVAAFCAFFAQLGLMGLLGGLWRVTSAEVIQPARLSPCDALNLFNQFSHYENLLIAGPLRPRTE